MEFGFADRVKRVFIYQPQSGDRILAFRAARSIVVIRWDDGCRTVYGGHHLELRAAEPKRWCRADARRLFEEVVSCSGGIAWDDRGVIHVVAPRLALEKVAWVLPDLLPKIERQEIMVALWRAKIARWQGGEFVLQEPTWKEEQAGGVERTLLVREEPEEGRPSSTRWRVRDAREGYGSLVVERPMKKKDDDGVDNSPLWWRGEVQGLTPDDGCGYCGGEVSGGGWYSPPAELLMPDD